MLIDSLAELRQFHQVAQTGSFTEAASVLGQTTAAVSAGVKRLEASLQVRLFERSTRSVRLTEEGNRFFSQITKVLAGLDSACESITLCRDALVGKLSIATASDFARGPLNRWLAEFQTLNPHIDIEVRVGDGLADLQRASIDLAVRFGNPADSTLIARPLSDVRQVACASPSYIDNFGEPCHPYDLENHQCLRYFISGKVDSTWRFYDEEQELKVNVSGKLTTDDSSIAKMWAIEGKGITYKSMLDVIDDIRAGRLVHILKDYTGSSAPLYLVYPSRENLPQRTTKLIDFLIRKCTEEKLTINLI